MSNNWYEDSTGTGSLVFRKHYFYRPRRENIYSDGYGVGDDHLDPHTNDTNLKSRYKFIRYPDISRIDAVQREFVTLFPSIGTCRRQFNSQHQ